MSRLLEIGSSALTRAATVNECDSGGVPQILRGSTRPSLDRLQAGGGGY